MADNEDHSKVSEAESEKQDLSKASAKRKYLLVDEDFEDLVYELKDNPINKKYAPMKVFKASEVKRIAITKWGSLENIEIEQEKRKERQTSLVNKKENEMRQFWDSGELYKPMTKFMEKIKLPKESALDEGQENKSLLTSDIIICYCDCMNSRLPGSSGKEIYKTFPAAVEVNKSTPYNDIKKMGHFSWVIVNKKQLIVNLYVVHKWNFRSKYQASFPMLNFDALELALERLSSLLKKQWKKDSEKEFNLSIGTYVPYRVDPEKFNNTLKEGFSLPHQVFNSLD